MKNKKPFIICIEPLADKTRITTSNGHEKYLETQDFSMLKIPARELINNKVKIQKLKRKLSLLESSMSSLMIILIVSILYFSCTKTPLLLLSIIIIHPINNIKNIFHDIEQKCQISLNHLDCEFNYYHYLKRQVTENINDPFTINQSSITLLSKQNHNSANKLHHSSLINNPVITEPFHNNDQSKILVLKKPSK